MSPPCRSKEAAQNRIPNRTGVRLASRGVVLDRRLLVCALLSTATLAACGLSLDIPFDVEQAPDAQQPIPSAEPPPPKPSEPADASTPVPVVDAAPTPTCSDGTRNDTETDVDCGGSCTTRCALGASCTVSEDCAAEAVCRAGVCAAAESCKALHEARPALPSGTYRVGQAHDGGDSRSGCEMTFGGGGWTLALKADGTKETFAYGSALWTSESLLNPSEVNLYDKVEAKLASYHEVSFSEVALMFEKATDRKSLVLPATSKSLADLIATGATSTRGRSAWLALLSGSSLQNNCNAEGFSVVRGAAKVRIGIIGNNETNCDNPDSFLGVGGGALCDRTLPAGNVACYNGTTGDRELSVFARVFVR